MYFVGCYFDPTYFDAAPCSTGAGHAVKGPPRRRRIVIIPPEPPFIEDDDELFALF